MRNVPYLLIAVLLLVPTQAFACMNSIVRYFTTYPLDFAHFGIAAAALILLRWPLTLNIEVDEEDLEPDELRSPSDADDLPLYPSTVRQFTILAVCVVAGVGAGFFGAKAVEFELTKLVGVAVVSSAMICAAIGAGRFETRGSAALRRFLLVVAMITSMISAKYAYDGDYEEAGQGFRIVTSAEIDSEINF